LEQLWGGHFSPFLPGHFTLTKGGQFDRHMHIDNIVVIGHGFQKKSQKTPKQQIERAEHIKREYYDSKE
jgi:phage-related protein